MTIENISNYLTYNSVLILSYFFLSFFVLILNYITKDGSNKLLFSTYKSSPLNPLTYVRLVTHILGHSDWKHFSNNFIYILLVGPIIEEKYGTINLLIMMIVTALIVGIINNLIGNSRLCGASSIVFMLIILSSFVNFESGKVPITLILIFIFYIVNEIIDGIFKQDNVSHLGHILGALCGLAFGLYFSTHGIENVDLLDTINIFNFIL